MKQVFFATINIVGVALLLAGLFFTGSSFYEEISPEARTVFLEKWSLDPLETTKDSLLYTISYMVVTPSLRYEWIGESNHQILFVEQLPLLDKTDIFLLFFTIITLVSLGGWAWTNLPYDPMRKALGIAGAFILLLITILLIYKALMFKLMLSSGADLGLTREMIEAVRITEWDKAMTIYTPGSYIGIGLFTSGLLLLGLFGKKKK